MKREAYRKDNGCEYTVEYNGQEAAGGSRSHYIGRNITVEIL